VKYQVIQQQSADIVRTVVFTHGRCTEWWCWNIAMSEAWQIRQSGGSKACCSR